MGLSKVGQESYHDTDLIDTRLGVNIMMKKILITGQNSYIGNSLERWLERYPNKYTVDKVNLKDCSWKNMSFSNYDVICHVAGIAHTKETKGNGYLYYKVNRDLAYETALKAKEHGIKQFIFLSSMSVYGIENGVINEKTPLKPISNYGKSKLQAEELITPLSDNDFKVAILRPPMIYGRECKGNYSRLSRMAREIPIFPEIDNKRSMIYIYNLCEFIRLLIDDGNSGLFLPQNTEYVRTSQMVKTIADIHGKKLWLTRLFNPFLRTLEFDMVKKVFGDLVYEKRCSEYREKYCVYEFTESIQCSELIQEGKIT